MTLDLALAKSRGSGEQLGIMVIKGRNSGGCGHYATFTSKSYRQVAQESRPSYCHSRTTNTKLQCFQSFMGFAQALPSPIAYVQPPPFSISTLKRKSRVSALKLSDNDDPLFSASSRASLRYQETLRPEPLFVDPYAGCIVPPDNELDVRQHVHPHPYCVATKFIDDDMLVKLNSFYRVRQVVLLTDGMDTRPYRISWPASTTIFDISPERVFNIAADKLQGAGAKIPRKCSFFHIPSESSNIMQSLHLKGFNGNRPSVWALQGFPKMTLAILEDVLSMIGSLSTKSSHFIGELPVGIADAEVGINADPREWMDKLFRRHGFRMCAYTFERMVRGLNKESASRQYRSILFIAEQERYSDDQMEIWRGKVQRIEDEGDEEGFEEL